MYMTQCMCLSIHTSPSRWTDIYVTRLLGPRHPICLNIAEQNSTFAPFYTCRYSRLCNSPADMTDPGSALSTACWWKVVDSPHSLEVCEYWEETEDAERQNGLFFPPTLAFVQKAISWLKLEWSTLFFFYSWETLDSNNHLLVNLYSSSRLLISISTKQDESYHLTLQLPLSALMQSIRDV